MKHLKRFNESSEEKLYWEIPFNNVYYNNLPTIDFNRNYAKIIMDNLNNEWTGNLVTGGSGLLVLNFSSEPPHWLDLNTNSGDKCVSIFQTDDDYFMCDYVTDNLKSMKIYQCDAFDGLLKFLKSENILV